MLQQLDHLNALVGEWSADGAAAHTDTFGRQW
jgi:hypothetical protein